MQTTLKLYMTILQGTSADKALPIVAIADQRLIQAVLSQLSQLGRPDLWLQSDSPEQDLGVASHVESVNIRESESGTCVPVE